MAARFLILPVLAGVFACVMPAATVWDGIYSEAQAARGLDAYTKQCAQCHHEDMSGYGGLLIGDKFMNDWREDSLNSFFTAVRQTMPRNAPGSLSDANYLDIVAYVMQMNSFPAGAQELKVETLPGIRVQDKQGPQAVPDFSLVEVVGCLSQDADKNWVVSRASEPIRTRNPNNPTPDEAKAFAAKPLGTNTYHLLDPAPVQSNPPNGHKVELKGLLIRKPGNDKVNPSSLESVADACPAK